MSLLRGGFRSITWLIGRTNPNGYQIRSKTATIGIRGTDHELVVILDTPGVPSQAAPGLYDKVNDGETFITKGGVVLPLRRGDVGFAPFAVDVPPQVLLKVPDFYKIILKTDARDGKDSGNDSGDDNKTDGKRRAAANDLPRPSLAAQREALSAGTATVDSKPATGTTATATATATATPTLTPDQKRAILQNITAPKVAPVTTAPTK